MRIRHEIRFIDSFKFVASSLDGLVNNLTVDKPKQTQKVFKDKIDLLSRKGVYPYDHMTDVSRFKENKLPPKEAFHAKLNDSGISDEDYDYADRVWNEFGIKNMGEYHDLYLIFDVLFLADVFEEFRKVCLENYDLDPAWYYTTPGLAWDTALEESGAELHLLTDVDMLLMIEKGIRSRGGISVNTLNISMRIIFMVGRCVNLSQLEILNGWVRVSPGVKFLASSRWTSNILRSCMIFVKIIHWSRRMSESTGWKS